MVAPWTCVAALVCSVIADSRLLAVGASVLAVVFAAYSIGRWVEHRSSTPAPAEPRGIRDVLELELVRARRWERPLTLLRIAGPVPASVARSIEARVRTTDELVVDSAAVWILMPEESEVGASAWWRRVVDDLVELPAPTISQFPVDALTVDGMLANAIDQRNVLAGASAQSTDAANDDVGSRGSAS